MAAGDIRKRVFTASSTYGSPQSQEGAIESTAAKLNDVDPAQYIGAYCKITRAPSRLPDTFPYWMMQTQFIEGTWTGFGPMFLQSAYDTDQVTIVTAGLWRIVGTNLVQGDAAEITIYFRA